ncbi:hypothetical protein CROQUDRAFT_102478 [Cronartium quercuum f. sp. fusiforme G11]|uniref:Uncharacterized protein n=1 Tax=Cronartium quercuum f. sp. fusiforme G11 TaxID=708437 RepID=A0A9P6N5A1_9BASI|nr:hypothetical protein CROQUDRAFT_102478 [Cronartium quercuum f. sp. fusiforme G11]
MITETHVLIIGVPKSNGHQSFQLVGGSPTALQFMNNHQEKYNKFDFCGEFQAWCTGIPVDELKPKVKDVRNSKARQREAHEALGKLLKDSLPHLDATWPWANCENILKGWGWQISFKEGATTSIGDVAQASSPLNDAQASRILADISAKRIELIMVPVDKSGLKKRAVKGTAMKSRKKQKGLEVTSCDPQDEDEMQNDNVSE